VGDEDDRNEAWLTDAPSEITSKANTGTFDDKYEFLDNTILGEVRRFKLM
jgi:hypothetical protein